MASATGLLIADLGEHPIFITRVSVALLHSIIETENVTPPLATSHDSVGMAVTF